MDKLKIKGAIVAKYGSQCLFAREIGVSECRLSRLLNGHDDPNPDEARILRDKLRDVLGANFFNSQKQLR